jgi:hypothetical protein
MSSEPFTTIDYDVVGFLAAFRDYVDNCPTAAAAAAASNSICAKPPQLAQPLPSNRLTDEYFLPRRVNYAAVFERFEFTLYCERPTTFNYVATYSDKTVYERYIDENAQLGYNAAADEYVAYLVISGRNYIVKKVFDVAINLLGCSYTDGLGHERQFYMAVGLGAPQQYKMYKAEPSEAMFLYMLNAGSQEKLDGAFAAEEAAAAAAAAGGEKAPTAPGKLQLQPLRYQKNPQSLNQQLFDRMYRAVKAPSAALINYYKSTRIGGREDYLTTVVKFIQLDKHILASAMLEGVLRIDALRNSAGTAYRFEIPFAYDPTVVAPANAAAAGGQQKESPAEPLESAIDLKCYTLQGLEADVRTYFLTVRTYNTPAMSNAAIATKLQENICASAGYYSSSNLDSCKCTGCCIPVSYKAQSSGLVSADRVAIAGAGLSAESLALIGNTDGCVRIPVPFKLNKGCAKFKEAPTYDHRVEDPALSRAMHGSGDREVSEEEGFVDLLERNKDAVAKLKLRNFYQAQKGMAVNRLG